MILLYWVRTSSVLMFPVRYSCLCVTFFSCHCVILFLSITYHFSYFIALRCLFPLRTTFLIPLRYVAFFHYVLLFSFHCGTGFHYVLLLLHYSCFLCPLRYIISFQNVHDIFILFPVKLGFCFQHITLPLSIYSW